MEIGLTILGEVKVNDNINRLNINSTGEQV
jgi:hypothetical protein